MEKVLRHADLEAEIIREEEEVRYIFSL
jgi:hypothetical protein